MSRLSDNSGFLLILSLIVIAICAFGFGLSMIVQAVSP